MEQVHGHDVISTIKDLDQTMSKSDLIETIVNKFGEETLFYNCSTDSMNAEQIISFFEQKGKLVITETGFSFGTPSGCKH